MRIESEALQCKFFRVLVRVFEVRGAGLVWLSLNASEKTFVIQKKGRGKNTLALELFK